MRKSTSKSSSSSRSGSSASSSSSRSGSSASSSSAANSSPSGSSSSSSSSDVKERKKPGRPKQVYECPVCHERVRDNFNLTFHMNRHLRPEKPVVPPCPICKRTFPNEFRLNEHKGPCERRGGISYAQQKAEWAAERERKEANKRPVGRPRKPQPMQFVCGQCGAWVTGGHVERLSHELECMMNRMADKETAGRAPFGGGHESAPPLRMRDNDGSGEEDSDSERRSFRRELRDD